MLWTRGSSARTRLLDAQKIGCDFSQPSCLSDQEETNCRRRHRQDAASVSGGLRHRPSTSLTRPSHPQSVRSNSDYGGELACWDRTKAPTACGGSEHRKPRFYIVEFRGRNNVFGLRLQDIGNFLLRFGDTVVRRGVRRKDLRNRARLASFLAFVSSRRSPQKLRDRNPSYTCTASPESRPRDSNERENFRKLIGINRLAPSWSAYPAQPPHEYNERNCRQIGDLAPRSLPRAVARRNVRDFVRHHAGQFSLGIGFQNQARVHEEESARQSESVHVIVVDNFDRKRNFCVRVAD